MSKKISKWIVFSIEDDGTRPREWWDDVREWASLNCEGRYKLNSVFQRTAWVRRDGSPAGWVGTTFRMVPTHRRFSAKFLSRKDASLFRIMYGDGMRMVIPKRLRDNG